MKSIKKLSVIIGTFVLVCALAFSSIGCGGKGGNKNNETRPLVMSIQQPDGVFNPFFSTSAYDSSVISMTQISMLNSDENGKVVYGDNEPCVVKDMQTVYNKEDDTTRYDFILKNGIKFSDGTPLTIKDVLFNLYVYLDPAYTGSATVYSTKILGLNKYRTQNPDANDKSSSTFEEGFINDAYDRIDDFADFLKVFAKFSPSEDDPRPEDIWSQDEKKLAARQKDFVTVATFFREELETDWNNAVSSLETYKNDWGFTDAWQVFLLNDGGYDFLQRDGDDILIKDENGNYKFDPAKAQESANALNAYLTAHNVSTDATTDEDKQKLDTAVKTWAINTVYMGYFPAAVDVKTDYVGTAFDEVNLADTISQSTASAVENIVRIWGTSEKVVTQWAAEAKTEHFANSDHAVPTIEGIDGTKKRSKDFSGKNLGAAHDVLSITIDGVDPKAIWNFGFTVAPMHYYSGTYTNQKGETHDYVTEFDQTKGNFGLEFGDINFMNNVINAPSKVGLPKGAGVYMASKSSGGVANSASDFMNLNMIYYERNPHFETLGSGINNAKIKYMRYRVVGSDQIINSITTGEVDIGDPNATSQNIKALNEKGVAHAEVSTNGYGYVGINPRFVPNIDIRRAIMKAIDAQGIINDYYTGGLGEVIFRPMSKNSWAYPTTATTYTSSGEHGQAVSYAYDPIGNDIEAIVEEAGYEKSGGVYQKNIPEFGVDRLDYEFTIAGSSTDHPLYTAFLNAQKILNRHGFAVKVVTSQTALSDLTTGKLAVWAAAWGSTIDPDMYQVYHKDSQATSVNGWGYKQIKAKKDTVYADEWAIIQDLSDYIDLGRSTDEQSERKDYYREALDLVMELAVEFPTYQRKDMTAYNASLIDEKSLTPVKKRTAYYGLLARMWEVSYK